MIPFTYNDILYRITPIDDVLQYEMFDTEIKQWIKIEPDLELVEQALKSFIDMALNNNET